MRGKPKSTFDSLSDMADSLLPEHIKKQQEQIKKDNQRRKEIEKESKKLTPEQLANWRKVAPAVFGISGDMLSDQDIEKVKDNLERGLNENQLQS